MHSSSNILRKSQWFPCMCVLGSAELCICTAQLDTDCSVLFCLRFVFVFCFSNSSFDLLQEVRPPANNALQRHSCIILCITLRLSLCFAWFYYTYFFCFQIILFCKTNQNEIRMKWTKKLIVSLRASLTACCVAAFSAIVAFACSLLPALMNSLLNVAAIVSVLPSAECWVDDAALVLRTPRLVATGSVLFRVGPCLWYLLCAVEPTCVCLPSCCAL